jgi:hypothetical protein
MNDDTNGEPTVLKSGPQTTEFWTTLISAASPWIAILVVLGMVWSGSITLSDATPILLALGIGGGLGGGYATGKYNESRASVKVAAMPY